MKISKESRRHAREMFRVCLTGGRLDPAKVRDFSGRLVAEKPRGYFQILKEFTRLVRLELERRHAVVESAVALPEKTAATVERDLRGRFGNDITLEHRVNPGLLGGLRVKVGSDVWDGTVMSRLQQLKTKI